MDSTEVPRATAMAGTDARNQGKAKAVKQKRCKVCRSEFQPTKPMQSVCGADCALSLAKSKRAKEEKVAKVKERKADAVKRESLKTRGDYIKEAQQAFNLFIRTRDRIAGYPCISSGLPLDWSGNNVDAGHFRSRGSAPHLRFDERNCHAQSKKENRYASGNVTGYRLGLIERIGLQAVEELEADHTPRRYSIDDLKEIKRVYAAKARELLRGMK